MLSQSSKNYTQNEQSMLIATSREASSDIYHGRYLKVLLVKPFQDSPTLCHSPPLGLLQLASCLREKFQDSIEVRLIDAKLHELSVNELMQLIDKFKPDVVGFSALNYEASVCIQLSKLIHEYNPSCITAIGGPYALHQSTTIFLESDFNWVFEGSSERSFPEALWRLGEESPLASDLQGFSWRNDDDQVITDTIDTVSDLDGLPLPAWDLCEFDLYTKKASFNPLQKPGRYATLFTSRGCPYLCSYCHDIFTKKFKWQGTQRVIEEIALLHDNYGVCDFQIVDDIFNLHKPRVLEILEEVNRRWPGKMRFSFPNGLRADILDQEIIDAMVKAGTYYAALAVETVTARLQTLIEKNLDVQKTRWAIDEFDRQGVTIAGFFMLGFPTESESELEATVEFAKNSKVSLAYFFSVVPQPQTPLYELAQKECHESLEVIRKNELEGGSYRSNEPWYSLAYNYELATFIRRANIRVYSNPFRLGKLLYRWPKASLVRNISNILALIVPGWIDIKLKLKKGLNRKVKQLPAVENNSIPYNIIE